MDQQCVGVETADVEKVDGRSKQITYSSSEARSFPMDVAGTDRDGQVARVRVGGGITKNMGNYESLRIDVSIDLPCLAASESIGVTFDYAKSWVSNKVNEMIVEAINNSSHQ